VCLLLQGSHPCYSKFTNFFRFRLSPLVSGAVYCAYLGYIIVLIPKAIDYHNDAVGNVRSLCQNNAVVLQAPVPCLLPTAPVTSQGGTGTRGDTRISRSLTQCRV
jgi:hypothetical protein